MRVLSESEVRRLVNPREIVQSIEAALEYSRGLATMPVRTTVQVRQHEGVMLLMPAFLPSSDSLGAKIVTIYRNNPSVNLPTTEAAILLNDPHTGRTLAVISGTYLTAIRTAAASAVATKLLSKPGRIVLAIVGAGTQGISHFDVLQDVVEVAGVRLFSRNKAKAIAFKERAAATSSIRVDLTESAEQAILGADVIVLATTAIAPIVNWRWFKPGCHINAIGSHSPRARELDSDTVASSRLVVDSREAVLAECGDVLIPIDEGLITRDQVQDEIGEVAAGLKPGRTGPDEVTLFKSTGIAVEDVAIADQIHRKALATGAGTEISMS